MKIYLAIKMVIKRCLFHFMLSLGKSASRAIRVKPISQNFNFTTVGSSRFELETFAMSMRRSNQLSYEPV